LLDTQWLSLPFRVIRTQIQVLALRHGGYLWPVGVRPQQSHRAPQQLMSKPLSMLALRSAKVEIDVKAGRITVTAKSGANGDGASAVETPEQLRKLI
jgi:hypothetical protein